MSKVSRDTSLGPGISTQFINKMMFANLNGAVSLAGRSETAKGRRELQGGNGEQAVSQGELWGRSK